MSETQDQNPKEKQVIIAAPAKSGLSWKRIFTGLLCGAFFFAVGYFWKDSVLLGIVFGVVAFAIGYFSGRAIY
ncbi:MAG: hypothetical protein MUC85_09350 [Anaerolineales bacterium]|nr:hypothetical protein [Anaerolineales bacterium]